MPCVWDECKNRNKAGNPCWGNRKGNVSQLYFNDHMMSYRTKSGCENSQMRGYEHANYRGSHFIMKDGAPNTPGWMYNRISSVQEVRVPTS